MAKTVQPIKKLKSFENPTQSRPKQFKKLSTRHSFQIQDDSQSTKYNKLIPAFNLNKLE